MCEDLITLPVAFICKKKQSPDDQNGEYFTYLWVSFQMKNGIKESEFTVLGQHKHVIIQNNAN